MRNEKKSGTSVPGKRLSNIEALRLLAMFMILVLHADYAALGIPEVSGFRGATLPAVTRIVFEQLSIVAVNVFVLISGWFGIRTTVKSVVSLLFQVTFYAVVALIIGKFLVGIPDMEMALKALIPGYQHWFIRSYLGLMILAPVLNAFVGAASRRQLAVVTGCFFLFEFIYGFWFKADGFNEGYSLLSFIGLYLLGRLGRLGQWERRSKWAGLPLYLLCVALATLSTLATGAANVSYASPLVVAGALGLLLAFARRRWYSRSVNALAASALAVYMMHFNPIFFNRYMNVCRDLYYDYDGAKVIVAIGLFLTLVFFASIAVDRLRILAWRPIGRYLSRKFV